MCYSSPFRVIVKPVMEQGKSGVAEALALVAGGVSAAAAAKQTGISRSAVSQAIKVREIRNALGRVCSECGALLLIDARPSALTCSGRCRVIRLRRLKSEAEKLELDAINRDRTKLGLPPLERLRSPVRPT